MHHFGSKVIMIVPAAVVAVSGCLILFMVLGRGVFQGLQPDPQATYALVYEVVAPPEWIEQHGPLVWHEGRKYSFPIVLTNWRSMTVTVPQNDEEPSTESFLTLDGHNHPIRTRSGTPVVLRQPDSAARLVATVHDGRDVIVSYWPLVIEDVTDVEVELPSLSESRARELLESNHIIDGLKPGTNPVE